MPWRGSGVRLSGARSLMASIGSIALSLHACGVASAVTQNETPSGASTYWPSRHIPFVLNQAGDGCLDSLRAARLAFAAWSAESCTDLSFEDSGTTAATALRPHDLASPPPGVAVVWRTSLCEVAAPSDDSCRLDGSCADQYNCWDGSTEVIAQTTLLANADTGELLYGVLELNGATFVYSTSECLPCQGEPGCVAVDVQSAVTASIPLLLGFTGVPGPQPGSVDNRAPAPDAVSAVCAVYPKGRPTPGAETTTPRAGAGRGCSAGGGEGAATASLLSLVVLRRRRRG
jgi:uncharacterized protein (TIGR03382 family)